MIFEFILLHIIFALFKNYTMPKKIKPTGKQKSILLLHAVIYTIGITLSWLLYDPHNGHWAYPWPAWTTGAWSLGLIGHACAVFVSYHDKYYTLYRQQQGKQ